ncbi:hypothetical protein [Paenibacillus silvae]|uniref:hypothetical protein n=1 Tax=Paenibacillus silvae TaxID=1325358 RepID=UPI00142E41F2|nr:hypothetical protein [Paenibacillus silvae]
MVQHSCRRRAIPTSLAAKGNVRVGNVTGCNLRRKGPLCSIGLYIVTQGMSRRVCS